MNIESELTPEVRFKKRIFSQGSQKLPQNFFSFLRCFPLRPVILTGKILKIIQ